MSEQRNFQKLSAEMLLALRKYGAVLIFVKGSPDPDVIASSYAVKIICDIIGVNAEIIAGEEPSLEQNRAFIRSIDIPISIKTTLPSLSRFGAYAILDHQSARVIGIPESLPCALHIDHHTPLEDDVKSDFRLIMEEAGSTSTIMAHLIRESGLRIKDKEMKKIALAITFGIQTDTDNYMHASKIDHEAISYFSPYADMDTIKRISGSPLAGKILSLLNKSADARVFYKDWLIAGIGFIDETERDSIAVIADYLLQHEDVSTAVVFAIVMKSKIKRLVLDASLRTKANNIDLDALIKQITSEGGARTFKGAYQVDLSYFINCPDRDMLWQTAKMTTFDTIRRMRDELRIIEFKGFFKKFRKKFIHVFSKALVFSLTLLMLMACSRKYGIERAINPVDKLDTEIKKESCGLIRSRNVDAAAEYISEGDWDRILKCTMFTKPKPAESDFRIPKIFFFHAVISNTGDVPVTIESISLKYSGREHKPFEAEAVIRKCKSPSFSIFNFNSILRNKRLLGDKNCIADINYERDVIDYKFDFINPGDTIIRITAFDWIPVENRDIRLVLRIVEPASGQKKIIDFDFIRSEYRTKGVHFIKLRKTVK
jgi:nanoRNase/pAp phosphatase (c-di-AMP/oligoRNAs hydrolase)